MDKEEKNEGSIFHSDGVVCVGFFWGFGGGGVYAFVHRQVEFLRRTI